MSNIEKQNIEKKLDLIWEKHKENSKKSDDLGSYVDVDTMTIRDAGINKGSLSSPGNFTSWKNSPSSGRYFLEGFGAGRTRLFKR